MGLVAGDYERVALGDKEHDHVRCKISVGLKAHAESWRSYQMVFREKNWRPDHSVHRVSVVVESMRRYSLAIE